MANEKSIFDRAFYCAENCPTPGVYNQPALSYDTLVDLLAAYGPLPPPEPIRLTQEQWDEVKAYIGPSPAALPLGAPAGPPPLFGVPIHIVDCVQDSTPYQRWLRNHVHFAAEGPGNADG